ncbi:hypothetical protein U9M48_003790, partial [Paspalum notatum var. saurae]
ASCRKKKKFIPKLKNGDQIVTSQEEKHQVLHDYYNNLIGTALMRDTSLDLQFFHRPGMDLSSLDAPISDDEVWTTIASLPSDWAPGPDGYTGRFYKACWNIIKSDFMAAILTLQQGNAQKLWLLNSAYLTLIPKKTDAINAGDFRPICLVHSFAKLVTKIMSNRLAPHLSTLVSSNQNAFIRGRCIHNNFMMVQQTIRLLHRKRVPSLFLKLDISKAFNSVSRAFLLEVLSHLGFGQNWRNLVTNLLATSSTQIILNGAPGEPIYHQRGLRQGDPLSPMLFILVMDVLNSLFVKAGEEGLLQPIANRSAEQRVSLYADDVALFIRPVDEELTISRELLDCFGKTSGLQTNLHKSCVIPIRCEHRSLGMMEQILHCPTTSFPSTYLGLPISNKKLRKGDLMPWIEKIADRLPGWKAHFLNLTERTVLVRFVLSAIPVYLLIALNIPKWAIKIIDKIRRAFLWKGRKEVNGGCCLVAWEKVSRPLDLGGLGIPNLQVQGWALQMRWLWLNKVTDDRPWASLDIPIHHNSRALFSISLISHVGNGANTLIWSDRWLHGCSLADLAPAVVACVPRKIQNKRTVAEGLSNRSWLWDVLENITLSQDPDLHVWRLGASGSFSSKSCCKAFFLGAITFEPWKRLWKSWALPKCKVFLWLALRNKCWTIDRLAMRGLPHPSQGVLCDQEEETVQHILTSCVFARQFWHHLLAPLGMSSIAPSLDEISFADWWKKAIGRVEKPRKKGFNSLLILGAWTLWNHRNNCVLKGDPPPFQQL